jgi:hypothetical protein
MAMWHRCMRWRLHLPPCCSQVGVIYDIPLKELRLFTDYGRASRPLFIVDDQRLLIKKSDIIRLQVSVFDLAEPQCQREVAFSHEEYRGPWVRY